MIRYRFGVLALPYKSFIDIKRGLIERNDLYAIEKHESKSRKGPKYCSSLYVIFLRLTVYCKLFRKYLHAYKFLSIHCINFLYMYDFILFL